jgi:hypothetical protein
MESERKHKELDLKSIDQLLTKSRELLESKGENCPVYTSWEKPTYSFTREEVQDLATNLWLIDNAIHNFRERSADGPTWS